MIKVKVKYTYKLYRHSGKHGAQYRLITESSDLKKMEASYLVMHAKMRTGSIRLDVIEDYGGMKVVTTVKHDWFQRSKRKW